MWCSIVVLCILALYLTLNSSTLIYVQFNDPAMPYSLYLLFLSTGHVVILANEMYFGKLISYSRCIILKFSIMQKR